MNGKIKKFPISFSQRRKNTLGPLVAECQVSGRYLKFHKKSSILQGGEFITIDVMSTQFKDNEKQYKICELIVTKGDLLKALNHVSPEE